MKIIKIFKKKYQLTNNLSINIIKDKIKNNLGDNIWQKVQALIYSSKEEIYFYENVQDALYLIGDHGYSINLVSHKSKYGIGESSEINIREIAATRIYDWIYKNRFKKYITGVNLCESLEEKIKCLVNLKPNIIVDDLLKVHIKYREINKKEEVKHILFNGTNKSKDPDYLISEKITIKNNWTSVSNFICKGE